MNLTGFKKIYYSVMDVVIMLCQALIGLVPAYFAIDGLMKVAELPETWYTKVIVWSFAIILEVLGISILKQATEAFLSRYDATIPAFVPIACGFVYVVNMILLTTLHNILPDSMKPLSIGLLCLMPVVGYVSSGMKEITDSTEIDEERQWLRKQQVEDDERKFSQQLRLMRENAKLENRTKIVPKIVPVERFLTEERSETYVNGTILEHIERNGYKSFGAISKDTGIPKTTVVRAVNDLVDNHKLHRIEDAGKVKYELNGWH